MNAGARTPDEVDTLLEDAFVLGDRAAFEAVFADAAVLRASGGVEARGGEAIAGTLAGPSTRGRTYVARTRRVLQVRDTALVVADAGLHVVRRDGDGAWRAVISLLRLDPTTRSEDP
jgi:hypothetical protein